MCFSRITIRNRVEIIEVVNNIVGILSEELKSLSHMNKQALIIGFERLDYILND